MLGSKLFLLCINYLCNISDTVTFILFADNINVFNSANNVKVLSNVVS